MPNSYNFSGVKYLSTSPVASIKSILLSIVRPRFVHNSGFSKYSFALPAAIINSEIS